MAVPQEDFFELNITTASNPYPESAPRMLGTRDFRAPSGGWWWVALLAVSSIMRKHRAVKKLLWGLILLVIAIAILPSGVPITLVIIAVLVRLFFRRRRRSRATESTGQPTPRSHIPASVEWRVIKKAKGRCVDCGCTAEDGVKMHIDHKVPLFKGGTNDFDNLCLRCERHNLGKGTDDDYRA
ncbi:uncharacterized protein METZ01_LOCUS278902 [marine metagenome]|uniref:HNH nuclease domain-containing protein n=1 Tax=marine metagenome TaxID=408172 RepID=A0A382KND8_9ZZZZ